MSSIVEFVIACQGAKTLQFVVVVVAIVTQVVAAMSDKSMMKLNNENYEIWKILMEAILVHKQLHKVGLGLTPRPAGPSNAVHSWDQKNQEARAKLQLAVKWD